jgi:hypothetical protein
VTVYIHYFDNPQWPAGTTDDAHTVASADPRYLEERLGISAEFWDHLLALDSDWAFVIQLHALVEAALTDALTEALRMRRNRDQRMSVGQKRDQLAGLCRLSGASVNYIVVLSTMRNEFVHDVRKVYSSLLTEFSQLTSEDVVKLVELSAGGRLLPQYAIEDARNWPREMLIYGCMNVLQEVSR